MRYVIGLDVGIASIGYSVLRLDSNGMPDKIIFLNSFIFTKAEDHKGNSLANERGTFRRLRRLNRRKKFRKHRVKELFNRYNLLTKKEINNQINYSSLKSVYELRSDGLDRKLNNKELFNVLYWFAGHRGFKSNRKSKLKDKDIGLLLNSLKDTKSNLKNSNYRTIGELYYKSSKFSGRKRNSDSEYIGSTYRNLIVDEVKKILNMQDISNNFEEEYIDILTSQRDFDEGPGSNSPYAGNQIGKMIGPDSLDRTRKRAAKATYTFKYFDYLTKINNLKYRKGIGNDFVSLTNEQKNIVTKKVLKNKKTNYNQVKKYLNLDDDYEFNLVDYNSNKKPETSSKISDFTDVRKIQDVLPYNLRDNYELIDQIATILTIYKSDKSRTNELKKIDIDITNSIPELLYLNYSKFCKLSIHTMKKIILFLEKGQMYYEAAKNAGYDFQKVIFNKKYLTENVTDPVVKRSVSKAIKIVDKITKRYGKPDRIHIELARELGKSYDDRRDILKRQKENKKRNDKIASELRELDFPVNGQNILKYKLYKEQHYVDIYSKKCEIINIEDALKDDEKYEIDHIIPYSISFDDSYNNKVLVSTEANREKGNRIPMDYLKHDPKAIQQFKTNAKKIKNRYKRERLLKSSLSEDEKNSWKNRNIQDTRYINKLLGNYLRQNIEFYSDDNKQKVVSLNGSVTAKIRSRWGIKKYRDEGDIHHAVDAVIIACITQSFIQKVTQYSKNQELKYNIKLWSPEFKKYFEHHKNNQEFKNIFNDFILPWKDFREELIGRVSDSPKEYMTNKSWQNYTKEEIKNIKPPFVVRMPIKKISGAIDRDTIRSAKYFDKGISQIKESVSELKLSKDNEIIGKDKSKYNIQNDGGNKFIWNLLYEKLSKRNILNKKLKSSDASDKLIIKNKIIELFPNGNLEYKKNGVKHIVKKVKVQKKQSNGVLINHNLGISDNAKGSMIRIDVFKDSNNKYVFVPIYRNCITSKKLPKKIAGSKTYYISEKDMFLFSLYPYDVIHLKFKSPKTFYFKKNGNDEKKQLKEFYGYYKNADTSTSRITIISNDNSSELRISTKSLKCFEKYNTDYFGNLHKVHENKRQNFK